jgi:hypothetical protein
LLKISIQNKCFARVLALENTGKSENVYDLTIEEDHEYFANGILVHNCIDTLRYIYNAANYHKVEMDEPLTEHELFPERRGFRISEDYSLKGEGMYGDFDSDLFDSEHSY